MLAFENDGRRFNNLVFYRYSRSFHHRTAKVSAQDFGAAMFGERFIEGGDNISIERGCCAFTPCQLTVIQPRFHGVVMQTKARNGVDIFMQQTAFEQFAHQYRHAARRLEVVNVRRAIRIQASQ